jgi:hypothetical protein
VEAIVVLLRFMLGVNAAFWILVGAATVLGLLDLGLESDSASFVGTLAILNGLCLALASWRALKDGRFVDLAILVLVVVNGVLSVTDELGVFDYASVAWNGTIVALLLVGMWKQIGAGTKGPPAGDGADSDTVEPDTATASEPAEEG